MSALTWANSPAQMLLRREMIISIQKQMARRFRRRDAVSVIGYEMKREREIDLCCCLFRHITTGRSNELTATPYEETSQPKKRRRTFQLSNGIFSADALQMKNFFYSSLAAGGGRADRSRVSQNLITRDDHRISPPRQPIQCQEQQGDRL